MKAKKCHPSHSNFTIFTFKKCGWKYNQFRWIHRIRELLQTNWIQTWNSHANMCECLCKHIRFRISHTNIWNVIVNTWIYHANLLDVNVNSWISHTDIWNVIVNMWSSHSNMQKCHCKHLIFTCKHLKCQCKHTHFTCKHAKSHCKCMHFTC